MSWFDLVEAEAVMDEAIARTLEQAGHDDLAAICRLTDSERRHALIVVAVRDPELFDRAVKIARGEL